MAILKNSKHLFLDDKRMPSDAYLETHHKIYIHSEWEVVESYKDFICWIIAYGVPKVVSFDHDLAPSHYTPMEYWNDYAKSKEWQENQAHTEHTGEECARWLVAHCKTYNIEIPICFVHSANPVGRDKIIEVLQ